MTDNLSIPTKEELMQSVVLDYAPFCTVFNGVPHEAKIGNVKFTTVRGDEDIVARSINAQDTERAHYKAGETSKHYAKTFKGGQYAESKLNARTALPGQNNKVIKAYSKQWDYETFNGVDNYGVIVSNDPNNIANAPKALPLTIDGMNGIDALVSHFSDVKKQVADTSSSSDVRFAIYGDVKKYFRKMISNGSSYIKILREAFPGLELIEVPDNLTVSQQGIICFSPQLVDLHYTRLPQVENTGVDERLGEVWVNYIFGSAMIDVKELGGIIRQPLTVAD